MRQSQLLKGQIVRDKGLLLGCWEYKHLEKRDQTDDEFVSKFISCHLDSGSFSGEVQLLDQSSNLLL